MVDHGHVTAGCANQILCAIEDALRVTGRDITATIEQEAAELCDEIKRLLEVECWITWTD
jgi:hypothetical protein